MKSDRGLVGAGFGALRRWRLLLLLAASAAALGGAAASPLRPALRDEIGGRLAGDHLLRNDATKAAEDLLDFVREKSSAVAGWTNATLWMAIAGLLLQIFYTGGIVETVGREPSDPTQFWSASRRHFAHNAKCFALAAILAAILLGIWGGIMGAAGKAIFQDAPPHTAGRMVWGTVSFLVGALLLAGVALLGALAKAARRASPGIGALRAFRDARRRLRGRWLQGIAILLFWSAAGVAVLIVLLSAAWAQHTPSGVAVAVNLLLLALSLLAIPAAKIGAWGSLLSLYDRTEEERRNALRNAVTEPLPAVERPAPVVYPEPEQI
ncbi:MAG TPA: hypothetical protein VE007_05445 [Thermoanaerobaculia bacterium]|nr:hypothetical protein [Thermoanaerobaculia bacterium]